ncbi:MAG: ABC transporter ATP-binding protein [Nocardioides sp.]|uniref:ABC transporter ATP-binding protein n=1 Tax=Nocardioides sp. TaxID=35761 RepID=UPI0039E46D70
MTQSTKDPASPRPAALRLHDLRVRYDGRPVLDGVDLEIPAGEILVVLGASGGGKSTLLRVVAGLLAADEGEVMLDGVAVRRPGADRALVFQDDALLPWRSAQRNVEVPLAVRGLPRGERVRVAREWLERVGLGGHARRLPGQLSGGQRQRVQLARALAGEPALLCMDEPFAALDAQTRRAMQELLIEVWQASGCTVLFVTHDVDEALALADHLVVLDGGRVAEEIHLDHPRSAQRSAALRPRLLAALGVHPDPQEALA